MTPIEESAVAEVRDLAQRLHPRADVTAEYVTVNRWARKPQEFSHYAVTVGDREIARGTTLDEVRDALAKLSARTPRDDERLPLP